MNLDVLLNFFSIMTFTSMDDQETMRKAEQNLISKMLKPGVYNRTELGNVPTMILPFLLIDHVESLDAEKETMTLHGSLILYWSDSRLIWNASDYHNVQSFTRLRSEMGTLSSIWMPSIHFTEVKYRSLNVLLWDADAAVTVRNDGHVRLATSISIETTCIFDGAGFPFDRQNCSFTMYTPYTADKIQFSKLTGFANGQVDASGTQPRLDAGDFRLAHVESEMLFLLGSRAIKNMESTKSRYVRSVVRHNVVFERHVTYYFATMMGPLIVITVLLCVLACSANSMHNIHFLFGLLACQLVYGCFLATNLPRNFSVIPDIAIFAFVAFILNIVIVLLKGSTIFFEAKRKEYPRWKQIVYCINVVTVVFAAFYTFAVVASFCRWWAAALV